MPRTVQLFGDEWPEAAGEDAAACSHDGGCQNSNPGFNNTQIVLMEEDWEDRRVPVCRRWVG